MSLEALNYVMQLSAPVVNRAEKLLLLVLANCHNHHRRSAWPSVEKMAVEAMLDERRCRRMLGDLAERNLIQIMRPEKQGRGNFTEYIFPAIDQVKKEGSNTPLLMPKGGQEGGQEGGQKAFPYKEELGTRNSTPPGSAPASPEDPHAITPDQRHRFFVEKYAELYMKKNRCPRSDVPWGPPDAAMLKAALKEHPGWSTGFIQRCLEFYFESHVNHAESPRYKLLRDKGEPLVAYRNGPLDRFGQPLEQSTSSGGGVDAAALAQRSRRRPDPSEVN